MNAHAVHIHVFQEENNLTFKKYGFSWISSRGPPCIIDEGSLKRTMFGPDSSRRLSNIKNSILYSLKFFGHECSPESFIHKQTKQSPGRWRTFCAEIYMRAKNVIFTVRCSALQRADKSFVLKLQILVQCAYVFRIPCGKVCCTFRVFINSKNLD